MRAGGTGFGMGIDSCAMACKLARHEQHSSSPKGTSRTWCSRFSIPQRALTTR